MINNLGLVIFIILCALIVAGLVSITISQSLTDEIEAACSWEEESDGGTGTSFESRQKPDKTTQG